MSIISLDFFQREKTRQLNKRLDAAFDKLSEQKEKIESFINTSNLDLKKEGSHAGKTKVNVYSTLISAISNVSDISERDFHNYLDVLKVINKKVKMPVNIGHLDATPLVNNGEDYLLVEAFAKSGTLIAKRKYNFKGVISCQSGLAIDVDQRKLILSPENFKSYNLNGPIRHAARDYDELYDDVVISYNVDFTSHTIYFIKDSVLIYECHA